MKAIAPGRRGMRRRGRWLLQETVVFSVCDGRGREKAADTKKHKAIFLPFIRLMTFKTREFFAFMLFQRAGNKI